MATRCARAASAQSGSSDQPATSESQLLADVMKALGCEPDFRIFRNNVGLARYDSGAKVRYGLANGSSDLIGFLAPLGRVVSLELKTATGRVRPEQDAWLRMVRAMGGFASIVRSVDDAHAALARARQGATQ